MEGKVVKASSLNRDDLEALNRGEIIAIRIPNFYSVNSCGYVADRMLTSDLYGKYANAPLIGRVGQAFFESLASDNHRISYETHAVNWIGQMRSFCEPYLSPIDKLRLTLDEVWPAGSQLASMNGKKMFVGLARVFSKGASAEVHQDVLAWDAPNSEEAKSLKAQFAANIYLKMPEGGGELLVWPKSLSHEEYLKNKNPDSYGIDPNVLGCEPVSIVPELGELILFNSRLAHAVRCPHDSDRITWSCFIGAFDLFKPLMMWS